MIPKLDRLKKLLWEEWDPIGVNTSSDWDDEYDSYALRVFTMLRSGAGKIEISRYLARVETDSIGMPTSDIHDKVAEKAVRIFEDSH